VFSEESVRAATGWNFTLLEWMRAGERVLDLVLDHNENFVFGHADHGCSLVGAHGRAPLLRLHIVKNHRGVVLVLDHSGFIR